MKLSRLANSHMTQICARPVCFLKDCITCTAICCPYRMPRCLSSSAAMLYRTKFYQLIVQILAVVAPLSVLHKRLWELTRATVALTSQALLVSRIDTVNYLKLTRRTTFSTNGCSGKQMSSSSPAAKLQGKIVCSVFARAESA